MLVLCMMKLNGQDISIKLIPDSLLENSQMVVREYSREIELQTFNTGIERIRKVLTVLNKNSENKAALTVFYDKNSTINIKKIVIYNSSGEKIKNVKQSDIQDYAATGSSELYSDDRAKHYMPAQAEFPYSIEYEYEINSKNLISYGYWRPLDDYNISVQQARLSIKFPDNITVNKKEINIKPASFETIKNQKVITWEVSGHKAIDSEPYNSGLRERIPGVYLMPAILSYDNYSGKASNWNEFGRWISSLYEGRNIFTPTTKLKLMEMTNGIKDTIDKIKVLYKYLQDNTRYVAITLGIGGFQPFDAETVYKTGYGDCKALTNFMHSLLKLNGIQSYPVLVAAGRYKTPIFKDFPNFQQFNHVILCIPNYGDTIWLECTSQTIPFGFLGDFTDDREVLLITEEGGRFSHTVKYADENNSRVCKAEFTIEQDGSASCQIETEFKGLQYDNMSGLINSGYDDQRKLLLSNSPLPSYQLMDFSISHNKQESPNSVISEISKSRNYCSFSGSYMILPLNLINVQGPIQKMLKPRFSDILINRSYIDYDTLVYKISDSYKIESLPEGSSIVTKFGEYESSVARSEKGLIYTRKIFIKEGRYGPEEYSNLYDFILAVSKADNAKVLLSRIR